MKYIVTESQQLKNIEHLKQPMFRYWDAKGPNYYEMSIKLFSIPFAAKPLVQEWLLEWMGGVDKLYKLLDEYVGKVMNCQQGSYNFNFYSDYVKIYVHDGVEIYFDAVVDGGGEVMVNLDNGQILDNVYDAARNDKVGWEVVDEIRDIISETLERIIDIQFPIHVNAINITKSGEF